jgi:outer membrane protein assembly factor BamB
MGLAVMATVAGSLPSRAEAGSRHLAAPPLTVSSRYVVVGAGPISSVGNTVYVGGVSRVAPATGAAVVVSTASRKAEPVVPQVTGGSVQAAIPDGAGGWYIGGTFTSVGGVSRAGLAHLLSDGTLDTTFAPPELGQVRALALDGGRLYVGGVQPLASDPWFLPFVNALDPATGELLPISYPLPAHTDQSPAFGVIALAAGGGSLFVAFNGDNGIAAYDEASGALVWSRPGAQSYGQDSGPAALALGGGSLLVGGQISTLSGAVYLEELDPATGALVAQPVVDGRVLEISTAADAAYVLTQNPHASGVRVWKLDFLSGTLTRVTLVKGASSIATDGTTLYVAGQLVVGGDVRVYALKLGQAKPSLRALSPDLVGGGVSTLALQGGRLLVGGSFLGLGGAKRAGLAAFNARTGSLLPWSPLVRGGRVSALAGSRRAIYVGGNFKGISGERRTGLAAFSAHGRKLLPWHPRLSQASITSLAVAGGRVFAGGGLKPWWANASTPFRHLLEFSATNGSQVRFKPPIGHVNLLAVGHRLVLAESSCNQSGHTASCVTAFRVRGQGRAVWRQAIKGTVSALQADGSRLYIGGACGQCRQPAILEALALDRSGALVHFAPLVPLPVSALARTGYGLVFATNAFGNGSTGPYFVGAQALGAITADGEVLPWQMTFPPNDVPLSATDFTGGAGNFAIGHLAVVPGGLVASGRFSWIGSTDDPASGTLVWLR